MDYSGYYVIINNIFQHLVVIFILQHMVKISRLVQEEHENVECAILHDLMHV